MAEPAATTQPDIGILKEGSAMKTVDDLKRTLALARSYRPLGWEEDQCELRRQYEGHILPGLLAAAARRFPATALRMPHVPFNFAAAVAEKGSAVYDEPPTRQLVDADGDVLPEEDDDADAFSTMIREAKLDVVLPEGERRTVLAKTIFLHVRSDSVEAMATGREPRTVVDLFWPNDVFVIPHPLAPTVLQASLQLLVRIGGSDPSGSAGTGANERGANLQPGQTSGDLGPASASYVHWRRDLVIGAGGAIVGYGKWRVDLVFYERVAQGASLPGIASRPREKIRVVSMWDPYPLKFLPFVAWHAGIPAGMPYMDNSRNLVPIFNALNGSLMSELHTVDMNSSPVLVHKTAMPQPSQVVIGPGVKVNILPQEDLESITQQADLAGMRATNEAMLETFASTMRQNPNTYVADGGTQKGSGVALKIENKEQEKARREAKARAVPMEQEELLPIMSEVNDWFRGTSILQVDREFRMLPVDPPEYETPAERQTRLAEAETLGWIKGGRAAKEAGYYKTVGDAEDTLEEIATEREEKAATALPTAIAGATWADPTKPAPAGGPGGQVPGASNNAPPGQPPAAPPKPPGPPR